MKKIAQTDAIFQNVFEQNQASDDNPHSLRISIDSKAKVKIGNLSRGGKARTIDPQQADDHDLEWQTVLVPFGILNTHTHQFAIYMGQSAETSDFIVDCLTDWWTHNRPSYPQLDEWVIDLDGGAATRSDRTQFINLIKGRFPVPWGVRSAKKWLFHTPSACGGVVDFLLVGVKV